MRAYWRKLLPLLALLAACTARPAAAPMAAAAPPAPHDGWFVTSDGVRLHYIDAGQGPPVVFVPGWTMPGWIFQQQVEAFSHQYRVIAFDPRGQGESDVPAGGYDQDRRGRDIADLLAHVSAGQRAVLVGWSLGVLDSLAYVHLAGDGALAGLVLIDNSVGEAPAPRPAPHPLARGPRRPVIPASREVQMHSFVLSMFNRPPDEDYVDRLTEASLHTPQYAAAELRDYRVPREYWRDSLYTVHRPVLYVVTPRLSGQAANVALHDPYAETAMFADAGHALFVDDADRFDRLLADFLARRAFK
jgi:microsomal epoxide hydrolase